MFRAGVLDALESVEQNQLRQAQIQEAQQRQARLAAEEARLREHQQMQMQEYARLNELRTHSGNTLAEMMKQMQLQNAPMQAPQPEQMAPGQASVPMMQPGEGMAPPINGLPPGMPPGMMPQGELPPGAAGPPAALSPNWMPSDAAAPELGGRLNIPPPIQLPPGSDPMARLSGPPTPDVIAAIKAQGGDPAAMGLGAPVAPPAAEAPKSPQEIAQKALDQMQLPGASRPGKLPPQWLSIPSALQAMEKAGVPADKRIGVMQLLYPMIEKQNKEEYLDAMAAYKIADETRKFYLAQIADYKAKNPTATAFERNMGLATQDTEQGRLAKQVLTTQKTPAATEGGYAAGFDKMTPDQQEVVKWYATQQLAGDNTWRVGLGRVKGGSELIKAVDEYGPKMANELGLTSADVGTNKAVRVASQAAHTAITKDLTTLKPYVDMLDQNGNILKDLAAKVALTDTALINKPLNYLRQNVTGNADVAELLAQVEVFKNEATRVISNPRLVGQMTDTARQEIEGIINGNMALGQIERVVDRLQNDGQRRIDRMTDQQSTLQNKIKELYPSTGKSKEGGAAPKSGGAPVKIKDQAEYDALPSGTEFLAPDGSKRRKP